MADEEKKRLETFLEFISRKKLNSTIQRRIIAEEFFDLPGHHSLEEFYKHIEKREPGIGQTTVYRTLKLLCEAGLANEIQFSDNITRYEVASPNRHHDHMICLRCGKIIEICDSRIENLQKEIAQANNFSLQGHSHNLYGYCAACQKSRAKES